MPPKSSASKELIRIRMYRVGFGDCFLVTFPGTAREHHVLVDCGVHPRGNIQTLAAVVDNILEVSGKHLDIVIATHAHQDHIAGFGACAEQFATCQADEVWMPWTEDPANVQALRLRGRQQALVGKLTSHFLAMKSSKFGAVQAALLNLASNQAALQTLRSGFRNSKVRYLKAGEDQLGPGGIQGLVVRVLGPGTDEGFLRQMDPPAKQRYLRLAGSETKDVDAICPFEKHWKAKRGDGPRLTKKAEKSLVDVANDPTAGLAFALDQAINNTSLATLFEYRGRSLFFPGDAQYGNWKAWLDRPDSEAVLAHLDFYKVSHHGSTNATPKSALEKMSSPSLAAMVSTQSQPWESIPERKLMDALHRKATRGVVRSDSLPIDKAPKGPPLGRLPKGFSRGALWFDYTIPLSS
jgi:beta-lactamase superfamily II metal-dependent hydrolase